jgi:anti-sigma factor RsiW
VKLDRLRTRTSEDCLSDLQLDALALGALDAAGARQAESHLAGCTRCSDRRRELDDATRSSADVLARGSMPLSAPTTAKAPRRSSRRVWLGSAMAAAAAAAVLLLIGRSPLLSDGLLSDRDVVRTKGAGRVGFFVRHAGVVRRGNERERVSPGSVYHPSGPRAARVEPGVERPLDTSVVLDDVLGEERLYALTCSEPIELAALRDGLRQTGAEPAWPVECSIDRFTLLKQGAKP